MTIPSPNKDETEQSFVSRAVEEMTRAGAGKDAGQRIAMAHDVWRRRQRGHADVFGVLSYSDTKVVVHDVVTTADGVFLSSLSGTRLYIPHEEFVQGNARVRYSDGQKPTSVAAGKLFDVQPDGDGLFRVNNVPIFQTYTHPKRPPVDEKFLDDMVLSFWSMREACSDEFGDEYCWLPKVHVGHTDDKDRTERPVGAFVDNVRRIGRTLYCDIRFVDQSLLDHLRAGKLPDRSIELDYENRRLVSVALLGATPPFFKLPQMRRFSDTSKDASKLSGAVARFSQDYDIEHRVETVRYQDMDRQKKLAQGLVTFMEAHGGTYSGDFGELVKFVDDFDGDLPGLYEMIRKAILAKKAKEQNTSGDYSLTVEELQKFVSSDGKATATCTNTERWFNSSNPTHGSGSGVDEFGTPTDAPRHFGDSADVLTFVDKLPENQQAPFRALAEENGRLRKFAQKFTDALSNMDKQLKEEREARKHQEQQARSEHYRAELVQLRAQGCTMVSSKDDIDQHLSFLADLPSDEMRQKYMERLQAAPKALQRERVHTSQLTQFRGNGNAEGSGTKKYMDEYHRDSKLRAGCRQMGIADAEQYALVNQYVDMDDLFTSGDRDLIE